MIEQVIGYVFGFLKLRSHTMKSLKALQTRQFISLLTCLHDQSKSGFFGGSAFIQPISNLISF